MNTGKRVYNLPSYSRYSLGALQRSFSTTAEPLGWMRPLSAAFEVVKSECIGWTYRFAQKFSNIGTKIPLTKLL